MIPYARRYSALSTTFGSTRDARQAGNQQAMAAITTIDGITIASVIGSAG